MVAWCVRDCRSCDPTMAAGHVPAMERTRGSASWSSGPERCSRKCDFHLERPMTPFNVGFVIFPDLTQLDFTGPLQVLSRLPGSKVHIIAKSLEAVPSDCGLSFVP